MIHEVTGLNDDKGGLRSQSWMADSSTTSPPILDPIKGDCWARCQLCSGITDIAVVLQPMKSLTLPGVVL